MNRLTKKRSGFTLIEILVVLIIVGVLAAIALPNLFGNVARSKAHEAFISLSSYKTMVEACLDGNCAREGTKCAGMSPFTSTTNFTYYFSPAPVNSSCNTSGLSTSTLNLVANGITAQGLVAGTDYIYLTRASGGTWTCQGLGKFLGVC